MRLEACGVPPLPLPFPIHSPPRSHSQPQSGPTRGSAGGSKGDSPERILAAMPDSVRASPLARCAGDERQSLRVSERGQTQRSAAAGWEGEGAGGSRPAETAVAAAETLLHVSSALGGEPTGRGAPLLLVCVDETDGHTLAAALAARLGRASTLNVCDLPLADSAVSPPDGKADGEAAARLLEHAAGCE